MLLLKSSLFAIFPAIAFSSTQNPDSNTAEAIQLSVSSKALIVDLMERAKTAIVSYALDHRRDGPFDDVFMACRKWYSRFPLFDHQPPLSAFATDDYPLEYERLASFSVNLFMADVEGYISTSAVSLEEWREIAFDSELVRRRLLPIASPED